MGQKKYPDELRERATRMALETLANPARAEGAVRRIADELGVHPGGRQGRFRWLVGSVG